MTTLLEGIVFTAYKQYKREGTILFFCKVFRSLVANKPGQSLFFLLLVNHTAFTAIISKLKSFKVTIPLVGFSIAVLASLKLVFHEN